MSEKGVGGSKTHLIPSLLNNPSNKTLYYIPPAEQKTHTRNIHMYIYASLKKEKTSNKQKTKNQRNEK